MLESEASKSSDNDSEASENDSENDEENFSPTDEFMDFVDDGNTTTSTSLQDVMSEQLASDIEAKENGRTKEGPKAMSDEEMAKLLNEDTSDDLVIAQMLQMQVCSTSYFSILYT